MAMLVYSLKNNVTPKTILSKGFLYLGHVKKVYMRRFARYGTICTIKKSEKKKNKTGRSVTLSKVGAFHVFSIVQMVPNRAKHHTFGTICTILKT